MEKSACGVELPDDFFMGNRSDSVVCEEFRELGAQCVDPRGKGLGEMTQFAVHDDTGADVGGVLQCIQDLHQDRKVVGLGGHRFDPDGGLERIGSVDDADPVAVPEQGQSLGENLFPRTNKGCHDDFRTRMCFLSVV